MKTIFSNPILETLTKTNLQIHIIWYLSIATTAFYLGRLFTEANIITTIILFVSGLLIWTLVEYIMHRFVFHFITKHKLVKRFHYIFHGIHHDHPRDERRTLMPPLPGLLFAILYLSIAWLFFGFESFFFISGLSIGYLIYSSLHHAIHIYKAPKFLRFLWTHYLLHHYQQPERAFGVTTRLWDRLFNTMPHKK